MEIIQNIKQGIMKTIEFDLKAKGHRGFQNFTTYPVENTKRIIIQSNKRIGTYNPFTGIVKLSKSRAGGSYFMHLNIDALVEVKLTDSMNEKLKEKIAKTSGILSNELLTIDNSQAKEILA